MRGGGGRVREGVGVVSDGGGGGGSERGLVTGGDRRWRGR